MRLSLLKWRWDRPAGMGGPPECGSPTSPSAALSESHVPSLSSLQKGGSSPRPLLAQVSPVPHTANTREYWPGNMALRPLEKGVSVYQVDREGMQLWVWRVTCAKALGHRWSLACLRRASSPPRLLGCEGPRQHVPRGNPGKKKEFRTGALWICRPGSLGLFQCVEIADRFKQGTELGVLRSC